jgi:hypothetical protein
MAVNLMTVNLTSAFLLFSTVVLSVGLGIGTAYGLVVGVLQAFAAQQEMATAPTQRKIAVPAMIASESHAGGD